ncbi:MAG: hypothetical protein JOZ47_02730 [Kutzneria sp.]|nr:hypothetical protein [Kutzneria sp.]
MIRSSDNDSATMLWDAVGGAAGMRAGNSRLGFTGTVSDPNDFWGLTITTVQDQLGLLKALTSSTWPLTHRSRAYVADLLSQVEADQVWGVSEAADAGTTPVLKNGWLPVDSDDDLWAINSIGRAEHGGDYYLVAVLSSS